MSRKYLVSGSTRAGVLIRDGWLAMLPRLFSTVLMFLGRPLILPRFAFQLGPQGGVNSASLLSIDFVAG